MKRIFKSIQWRLQIWHGAILMIILTAIVVRVYFLDRQNRLQLIDQELQRELIFVASVTSDNEHAEAIRKAATSALSQSESQPSTAGDVTPNRRRQMTGVSGGEDLRIQYDPSKKALLDAVINTGAYYACWAPDDVVLFRSEFMPANTPPLQKDKNLIFHSQTREDCREHILSVSDGQRILVGRSIARDLAEMKQSVWRRLAAGSAVMAFGLAGGWWMAIRTIQPIRNISATAEKIASGNLAERIDISDTESELGNLAAILNSSFDHVQKVVIELQETLDRQAQFVADASHELRTPVAVVLAEASSALALERTPAEYREALEACLLTAKRMRRLVESLLSLAKAESGRQGSGYVVCELDLITRDVVEALRPIANEQQIQLNVETVSTQCYGHPEQLEQVVVNLVSNAIYYNRPCGQVWIKVQSDEHAAVITIKDTGRGISEEVLPYIFERFYRADLARSSTSGRFGLGLAISKLIVETHSGTIEVASVMDEGSTFTVRIPTDRASGLTGIDPIDHTAD